MAGGQDPTSPATTWCLPRSEPSGSNSSLDSFKSAVADWEPAVQSEAAQRKPASDISPTKKAVDTMSEETPLKGLIKAIPPSKASKKPTKAKTSGSSADSSTAAASSRTPVIKSSPTMVLSGSTKNRDTLAPKDAKHPNVPSVFPHCTMDENILKIQWLREKAAYRRTTIESTLPDFFLDFEKYKRYLLRNGLIKNDILLHALASYVEPPRTLTRTKNEKYVPPHLRQSTNEKEDSELSISGATANHGYPHRANRVSLSAFERHFPLPPKPETSPVHSDSSLPRSIFKNVVIPRANTAKSAPKSKSSGVATSADVVKSPASLSESIEKVKRQAIKGTQESEKSTKLKSSLHDMNKMVGQDRTAREFEKIEKNATGKKPQYTSDKDTSHRFHPYNKPDSKIHSMKTHALHDQEQEQFYPNTTANTSEKLPSAPGYVNPETGEAMIELTRMWFKDPLQGLYFDENGKMRRRDDTHSGTNSEIQSQGVVVVTTKDPALVENLKKSTRISLVTTTSKETYPAKDSTLRKPGTEHYTLDRVTHSPPALPSRSSNKFPPNDSTTAIVQSQSKAHRKQAKQYHNTTPRAGKRGSDPGDKGVVQSQCYSKVRIGNPSSEPKSPTDEQAKVVDGDGKNDVDEKGEEEVDARVKTSESPASHVGPHSSPGVDDGEKVASPETAVEEKFEVKVKDGDMLPALYPKTKPEVQVNVKNQTPKSPQLLPASLASSSVLTDSKASDNDTNHSHHQETSTLHRVAAPEASLESTTLDSSAHCPAIDSPPTSSITNQPQHATQSGISKPRSSTQKIIEDSSTNSKSEASFMVGGVGVAVAEGKNSVLDREPLNALSGVFPLTARLDPGKVIAGGTIEMGVVNVGDVDSGIARLDVRGKDQNGKNERGEDEVSVLDRGVKKDVPGANKSVEKNTTCSPATGEPISKAVKARIPDDKAPHDHGKPKEILEWDEEEAAKALRPDKEDPFAIYEEERANLAEYLMVSKIAKPNVPAKPELLSHPLHHATATHHPNLSLRIVSFGPNASGAELFGKLVDSSLSDDDWVDLDFDPQRQGLSREGDPVNKKAPPIGTAPEAKNGAPGNYDARKRKSVAMVARNWWTGSSRLTREGGGRGEEV